MNLIVKIERYPAMGDCDEDTYLAFIDQMPGLVESGKTEKEAFEELMISLKVKIAHDSGIEI